MAYATVVSTPFLKNELMKQVKKPNKNSQKNPTCS